jgi:predicted Fe-Mo cluster-binding NifX family protein
VCLVPLMNVAIPQWQGRVSPVFDVAANLVLIEVADTREVGRQEVVLTATDPTKRARQVAQLPANVLICGAISWPLELALGSVGVKVISQICGQVEEVMQSFLLGNLENDAFRMPGCCGRRRFRGGRGHGCTRQDGHRPMLMEQHRRIRRSHKGF